MLLIRLLPVTFLALLVAGCSKVSLDNYSQIKVGMRHADVRELLGAPTRCSDVMTIRNCTWGDERRSVNVSFVGDQVVLFSSENLR